MPPSSPPHVQASSLTDRIKSVLACPDTAAGRQQQRALGGRHVTNPLAYLSTSSLHPPHALWMLLQARNQTRAPRASSQWNLIILLIASHPRRPHYLPPTPSLATSGEQEGRISHEQAEEAGLPDGGRNGPPPMPPLGELFVNPVSALMTQFQVRDSHWASLIQICVTFSVPMLRYLFARLSLRLCHTPRISKLPPPARRTRA